MDAPRPTRPIVIQTAGAPRSAACQTASQARLRRDSLETVWEETMGRKRGLGISGTPPPPTHIVGLCD